MAKYTTSISADGSVYVCHVNKKRDFFTWQATILAYGTWGGGTITWQISPDGGTTKIPLKDISGASITSNADDNFTVNLGGGSTNSDAPQIWATLASATGASINIVVYDNNL